MRIFFIGSVQFSRHCLLEVLRMGGNVVGVATKSTSTFNSDHCDLSPICHEESIPCKYVRDINAPHIADWIASTQPDVIFCFGWSSLIQKNILKIAPLGVVGFHPAKLPLNRGRHPLIWALVLGLEETGSSFFFMDEGADSGDILSQRIINIAYEDDAAALYNKVIETAKLQIGEFLPQLSNNNFSRHPQDHGLSNYWRRRYKNDGKIDFRMTSRTIYNLVRGLTHPYAGAHINIDGEEIKVWKVREIDFNQSNIEPGKILSILGRSIIVKTQDKAVEILEHNFNDIPKVGLYL